MGRQADPGAANSEIFVLREASRRLDHGHAVWGRVVQGLDVVRAIAVGEPPSALDKMIRVRGLADIAPADRPRLEVMDVRSPAFARAIDAARQAVGRISPPAISPFRQDLHAKTRLLRPACIAKLPPALWWKPPQERTP